MHINWFKGKTNLSTPSALQLNAGYSQGGDCIQEKRF